MGVDNPNLTTQLVWKKESCQLILGGHIVSNVISVMIFEPGETYDRGVLTNFKERSSTKMLSHRLISPDYVIYDCVNFA